jgi:hypothetical protein
MPTLYVNYTETLSLSEEEQKKILLEKTDSLQIRQHLVTSFDTSFIVLSKFQAHVLCYFNAVLQTLTHYNSDFRTKKLIQSFWKTQFNTRLSDYDEIEPNKITDFIVYLDDGLGNLTEIPDISLDTLRIDFKLNSSPSTASFTLARHHDDFDYLLDGITPSQISNLNKIVIYDGTEKLFTGYITNIDTTSDNDAVSCLAEDIRYKLAKESTTTWYGGKYEYPDEYHYTPYKKTVNTALIEVLTELSGMINGYDSINFGNFIPEYQNMTDSYSNIIDSLLRVSGNINWYVDEEETVRFIITETGLVKDLPLSSLSLPRHTYEVISNNITINKKRDDYITGYNIKFGKEIIKHFVRAYTNGWLTPPKIFRTALERIVFVYQSFNSNYFRYVGIGGIIVSGIFHWQYTNIALYAKYIIQYLASNTTKDIADTIVGSSINVKDIDFSMYGVQKCNEYWTEVHTATPLSTGLISPGTTDNPTIGGISSNPFDNGYDYLVAITEENYDLRNYAIDVAQHELSQINKLITQGSITILLDAYEYYNLSFKDRVNLTNTIRANIYKNNNGFPLHIDGISIDCSTRKVTLTVTNYGKSYYLRTSNYLNGFSPKIVRVLAQKQPRIFVTNQGIEYRYT